MTSPGTGTTLDYLAMNATEYFIVDPDDDPVIVPGFYDSTDYPFPDDSDDPENENRTTKTWGPKFTSTEHLVITSLVLGLMILATIIGNVFVIAAVVLERKLHNVANYLILSLAVADLMVASLVMPVSVVNEISTVWFLSSAVCDMWVSFDVLCCTASILHLVAISIDRYWAVTNIDYIRNRSAKTIITMIAIAWILGLSISIPPLFGWKDDANEPTITGECVISQDLGYTVFSTMGAFYLPMVVMMIIYTRIYQVARSRIRKENFHKGKKGSKDKKFKTKYKPSCHSEVTSVTRLPPEKNGGSVRSNNGSTCAGNGQVSTANGTEPFVQNGTTDEVTVKMVPEKTRKRENSIDLKRMIREKQKEKIELKRERKAARTLGIITGAFILCWLPFFIIALMYPFCHHMTVCQVPPVVRSIVLWLGYFNSLLNPIIYTIFSPEFREAFRKILFGKYRNRNR
ncbi:5-hydroxytryptamine receptor-like [Liolophura sinensis]|uniref:5-hydroxytryptamine receptor-like n=1 Tax=Liolophura sinensis TaxID=3198878 RepID=UPI0031592599